jgi:hypothetical protein
MLTRCLPSNPGRVQTRSAAMRSRKHPKDQHIQGWSSGSAIPRARAGRSFVVRGGLVSCCPGKVQAKVLDKELRNIEN